MLLPRFSPALAVAAASLSLLFTPVCSRSWLPDPPDASAFENSAVVRSIDLGGATSSIVTTFQVKSLQNGSQKYFFALSDEDASRTSWMEAKLKGSATILDVETWGHADHVMLYTVTLPKPLAIEETATIVLSTLQSHASTPVPAKARQTEPQGLVYETGLYVLSVYPTAIQRIKLRAPTTIVLGYTDASTLSQFAEEDSSPVSKSGATVTYGPFRSIPPSTEAGFIHRDQRRVQIHYKYGLPVITVPRMKRAAEISHWGSNLNIQDEIWLQNDGAKLKGHFSRVEHMMQTMNTQAFQPYILRNLVFHLPSNVRDPYYYDTIGNVSTSQFRAAVPRRTGGKRISPLERLSVLELKPRYPLMGGWNYTFTLGYDMPLEDWAGYDASQGAYVAAIPFITAIPGAAYDNVELKVVLPEGAKVIAVHTPFEMGPHTEETHITYLDTVGRPCLLFKKQGVTEKHASLIYVTYAMDAKSHLLKPTAVTTAFFGMFVFAMVFRRVDFSIHTKKHV